MTQDTYPLHLTAEERRRVGDAARIGTPLDVHDGWEPAPQRPDPVDMLEAQNATRDPDLVPVRHGRMVASPFTFFRGAATVMAADLAGSPTAGLGVQLCGDAHLSNFGGYASPERQLVFDVNDFDETLPGPFEYDVKRLAASFVIAARNNQLSARDARHVAVSATKAYRKAMAEFAGMSTMDLWYARMSEHDLRSGMENIQAQRASATRKKKRDGDAEAKDIAKAIKRTRGALEKAHRRTSLQALSKLTEVVDSKLRIVSVPPSLVPLRELGAIYSLDADGLDQVVRKQFHEYRASLPAPRRVLLDRFEIVDIARKAVGVGSVGTRAFVVLLQGRDERDALFLQVKEATRSVLEAHLPATEFDTPGERVVHGQQLMQSASDIFLGWSVGVQQDRYFYWRQLRDMKGSAAVESMTAVGLALYARFCGWTLARAHARSGDAVAIAAYLHHGKSFDVAITDFAARYADQNELDFRMFRDAISSGRLPVAEGT